MLIKRLELPTPNLRQQYEYYRRLLELPAEIYPETLTIRAGRTELIFKQAPSEWKGAYHFCFNIPENQFTQAKKWISVKTLVLKDKDGQDEFQSESWNSESIYFKDAAGNVLEFIARHNQKNATHDPFTSKQILQISEIGLPSKDVISLAADLCSQLGVSIYRQEASETFTPIGDQDGLLILPAEGRIWIPNTGVPAKMLPVHVDVEVNGKNFRLSGVPYKVELL